MLKVSTFAARNEQGYTAVPLFGPADGEFEKTASASLLPPVLQYIEGLRPRGGSQYVLVNALAASEYFGSNINGDAFPEAALMHAPSGMTGNPLVDKALAKDWPYGYPTFYNAHPFCFPAGSVVTMGDRTRKPIDEIEVGEFVATKAGSKEVASVHVRDYDGEGIRLTLRGVSDELTATADHPVLVYRRAQVHCRHKYSRLNQPVPGRRSHQNECVECHEPAGDPEWVPIGGVDVGDYMVLPPARHGDKRVPREFAELLGWVASEGHLGKKGLIQFSFSENNADDVTSVARCLEENGLRVTRTPRPQYGLVMLSACSAELSGKLAEYVTGVLSEKRFTEKVLDLDESALCSLLGTYIDGDGHICPTGKNKGQLRIRSSSPGMLDILGDILRSIGVEATVNRDRDPGQPVVSPTNGRVYYDNGSGCVTVSASWLPELLSKVRTRKHVEATPCKSRKYDRVNGDVLVQVTHREEIHLTEKVYCLSVPGPEHYLVSDVVVHNSHHRNKDPSRAYGEVELALWNDHMKRVELVVRVDYDKCVKFGGVPVWDKLVKGQFPDVSMGCFLKGTLVTMADGTRKPIEDIREGDRVLTHKGRPRRVRGTMRRPYTGNIYTIKPEAGAPIQCTENHPFYAVKESTVKARTYKGYQKWLPEADVATEWLAAKRLQAHVLVEPVVCGTLTPDYATREFCRLLGYYLAEGHVLRNKQGETVGIQLSTHRDDAVHAEIESLCAAVATHNPPSWADSAGSRLGKYIYIHDRWLAVKCEELAGTGAKTKRLSEEVLHWHPDLQAELLGAFANGDGCNAGKGALRLSTSNRDLAFQLLAMLPRLGVAASLQGLTHKAGKGFSRSTTKEWVVHISKQYVQPFVGRCDKLHVEEVLKEKNSRKFFGDVLLTPIRKVEKAWMETEVYNIDVDEDDSYLIGNLAVHNSKVPYDTSSITLDWEEYGKAQDTFKPDKHKHPGIAVLEYHKKLKAKNGVGIRGISITRDDYDEYCLKHMNRILPDGRKVFVYNDYPRFFDISFVFIGADRTAKVMVYIRRNEPGVKVAEALGCQDLEQRVDAFMEKKAGAPEDRFVSALLKGAEAKQAEIDKEVIPSQMAAKAVPVLCRAEMDLPEKLVQVLSSRPEDEMLSTVSGMGMVLKPHEFQRISLIRMGKPEVADAFRDSGIVFQKSDEVLDSPRMSPSKFAPALAKILSGIFELRTALSPSVEKRAAYAFNPAVVVPQPSSHSSELLRKIGAAYNTYRTQLIDMAAAAPELIKTAFPVRGSDMMKVAMAPPEETFSHLSFLYLRDAYTTPSSFGAELGPVVQRH